MLSLFIECIKCIRRGNILEILELERELGHVAKTCYDLEMVNKLIKECPEKLVAVSEKLVDDQIEAVVKQTVKGKYKFLLLSGPSSSGKTTTANIIIRKLKNLGKRAIRVSLDDFFLDLDKCARQADGTVDMETVEKIDLPCFNKFFNEIMKNNKAVKPIFDFVNNRRAEKAELIEVNENDLILVEGTHALNPRLIDSSKYEKKVLRVYACVNSEFKLGKNILISSRKIRLIRRMIRDVQTRGESVEATVKYWNVVCRGEDNFVSPFRANADFLIDTTHIYELAVYDKFVPQLLEPIKNLDHADELLQVFGKSGQLSKTCVPKNSLLWEFLVK